MMNRRDDLRKRDATSPELPRWNKDTKNRICTNIKNEDFVEAMDLAKLWRTIKGIDVRAKREAENKAITFQWKLDLIVQAADHQVQSPVQRHTSSRETRRGKPRGSHWRGHKHSLRT